MNKKLMITLIIIAVFMTVTFSGCDNETIDIPDEWEVLYSSILSDVDMAPDSAVINSRLYDIQEVYSDSTLSNEEKTALMMKYATYNESKALRYAYFNSTQGSTELSSKSGTLIYQRTRRQNLTSKYDVTLKLPVNHNFDMLAKTFVTDSTIRLVTDGKYYRMSGDDASMNDKGALTSGNWKKVSGKFNVDEDIAYSQDYESAQKSAINYDCPDIITDGAEIELVESDEGNYYRLTFAVDVTVANADDATMDKLEKDNSGSNMSYNHFNAVVEIWTSGFFKFYSSDESWQGKIQFYNGSAQSATKIVYSYSERDNDISAGLEIKDSLL